MRLTNCSVKDCPAIFWFLCPPSRISVRPVNSLRVEIIPVLQFCLFLQGFPLLNSQRSLPAAPRKKLSLPPTLPKRPSPSQALNTSSTPDWQESLSTTPDPGQQPYRLCLFQEAVQIKEKAAADASKTVFVSACFPKRIFFPARFLPSRKY